MKPTTVAAIALVLVNVLLFFPDGTSGIVVYPGSRMRPQRAIAHGHFRQPGPVQLPVKMAAGRPRYARFDQATGPAKSIVTNTATGGIQVVQSLEQRQTAAVDTGADSTVDWVKVAIDQQQMAVDRAFLGTFNIARDGINGGAAVVTNGAGGLGSRSRRSKVNL